MEVINIRQIAEEKKKPTYKMSVSLINSMLWYHKLRDPEAQKNAVEQLGRSIQGIYDTNEYFERGKQFEKDVEEGKHEDIKKFLGDAQTQVWKNKTFDKGDYSIRVNAKLDYISKDGNTIYDLKRTNSFSPAYYEKQSTIQHLMYFYLTKAKEFYYIVAPGIDDISGVFAVKHERPDELELALEINGIIDTFIAFLKEHDLWELYKKHQEVAKN